MKIDVNYRFRTLDGEPMKEQGSNLTIEKLLFIKTWEEFEALRNGLKKGKPFTLKAVATNVLLMTETDGTGRPKELKGEEKVERYVLAMKIYNSDGLVDLKVEEISLLKKLIGRAYGPLTVGQAWEVLDPHEAAKNKTESEKEPEKKEGNNKDNGELKEK